MGVQVSLASLKTQIRQRTDRTADDPINGFVTDSELVSMINNAWRGADDLIINTYEDYRNVQATPILTVSGQRDYPLPSDFLKLRGVDALITGNQYVTVQECPWKERNRYSYFLIPWIISPNGVSFRYHVLDHYTIRFMPSPNIGGNTIQLSYVNTLPPMVNTTDTIEDYNGWISTMIIADVGRMIMLKEESDPSGFIQELMDCEQNVRRMAKNHDAASAQRMTSTRNREINAPGTRWL
jgi:hypothetical protein